MSGLIRICMALVALAGLLAAQQALGQARVALVIGNARYEHAPLLRDSGNDAQDMAAALRQLGYSVQLVLDAKKAGMDAALATFSAQAAHAGQAIVYFSGHGLEARGVNYLLPVDAQAASERTVPLEAVALPTVMDIAASARELGLVVLDACRDSPLGSGMERSNGTKGAGRGLASVEPSGSNLLVAYATRHGQTAADGQGRNSPYTAAILEALQVPGLEVRQLWGRVRNRVLQSTGQTQEPFTYGTLGEEALYLNPPASPPPAGPGADVILFQSAQRNDTVIAYRDYLSQYPHGQFVVQAQQAIVRLQAAAPPASSSSSAPAHLAEVRSPPAGHEPAAQGGPVCAGCPAMVRIPAGRFQMGSPASEAGRFGDEGPQRWVQVPAFLLAKNDVTFEEWDACVAAGGRKRPSDEGWGREQRPVINVSWDDVHQYIAWLNRRTGLTYRLPSEAEWEYAARAGTTTAYYWGDSIDQGHANCGGCGSQWDGKQTAPVGSFDANPWGLYDMAGNVGQWTEDCRHFGYADAPADGRAWTSGAGGDCTARVVRGGSWNVDSRLLRSACRLNYGGGSGNVGLRLARTP